MSIQKQLDLLEKLCNASGVSGDEGEVRELLLKEITPLADEVRVDALGSILVTKRGQGKNLPRLLLDCHMDEVGLMIVADEGEGLYRFELVGGIDLRSLPGKQVLAGKEKFPGVIGARPIHLTTPEERQRKIPLDSLRIDLGPGGAGKLKPGDRAVFATRFRRSGKSLFAKAIDNRIGCLLALEALKNAPRHLDLCLSFSVQEEIGLRGAKVAAFAFKPHFAIALDATPAYDFPVYDDSENTFYNTHLGLGPAIYTFDSATLNDPRLVRFLMHTAEQNHIPYQLRQPGGGGTDAGAIHRAGAGVPTVSLSVPHRYSHTAISLLRLDDWKNTQALLLAALPTLSLSILDEQRP